MIITQPGGSFQQRRGICESKKEKVISKPPDKMKLINAMGNGNG
jgi:hypothetical protein